MIKNTILTIIGFLLEKQRFILKHCLTKTMGKFGARARTHYLGKVNGKSVDVIFNSYLKHI